MQVTSCKIANNEYMQIYLTEEEYKEKQTKEVIEKYKKEKYRVAIFITGKESYPEILKKIIIKQVELSNHVC